MTVFDFDFAVEILPVLAEASLVTIQATIVSFFVAAIAGLFLAIGKRARSRWIRWPIVGITEFIRSTPLLIQLYFLYFVLPAYGVTLSPFLTGVIGLGLHWSCYTAEAYRAGLNFVPKGQWEAAIALNYGPVRTFTGIILPQAIPPIVPAMGNYLVAMFKDTPLLATITVVELMQTATVIGSETFLYTEPMTLVGLFFLVMSVIAAFIIRRVEYRIAAR